MIVCFVLMIATLAAGGGLTTIGPWYLCLSFPPWKPPNWAFAPVWTVIGICTALSAGFVWRAAETDHQRLLIGLLFGVNAVLNICWSLLFFRLRRPDWALIEVALLWMSVLAPVVMLWPIRRLSGVLLIPYLVWVAIAAALNLSVVRRNAPFGISKTVATGY